MIKISQNLSRLWFLKFNCSQFYPDTFYAGNIHLSTSMIQLIKPSRKAKSGTQKQFFYLFNRRNVSLNLKEKCSFENAFS